MFDFHDKSSSASKHVPVWRFPFFLCPVTSQVTTLPCPIKCQKILDSSIGTCPTTAESLIILIAWLSWALPSSLRPSVLLPHRAADLVYIHDTLKQRCPENDPLIVLQLDTRTFSSNSLPKYCTPLTVIMMTPPTVIIGIPIKQMFAVKCSFSCWQKL